MFSTPIIQVAGIRNTAEAELVASCGATHLGFPQRLGYHTPDCTDEQAREIIQNLPARVTSVMITYQQTAREIADLADFLRAEMVQLHGAISAGEMEQLRTLRPSLGIIKSLVVTESNQEELRQELLDTSPYCDLFITDTFDPDTGAMGATGKTHDWSVSRELVRISPRPVILAGGLNAENVGEAIRIVRPAGVDAHTGLEDVAGGKAREKVKRFVANARRAFKKPEELKLRTSP